MRSNIEIKAKVRDLNQLRGVVEKITTEPRQILHQEDVFFRAYKGRLKLRFFTDGSGELIQYERPNTIEAKQSNYRIYRTPKPAELKALLSDALGETVKVKKKREVYVLGQSRIHLDEVDELGNFIELEVVLTPKQTPEEGRRIVAGLMDKLGVQKSDLLSCAYADLLLNRTEYVP